ncbi:MAG: MBL fold metallo-hydrolase, partial [Thermoplasmata archaeon]|nr:MBL fold metallo-hydrolase [Thermoplasmata archaeon]
MTEPLEPVRMRIPTQLPVATVNVYLLRGDENVLVDAGPHHPDAWDYLTRRLKAHGLEVADIDRILITHGHVDHYGQAGDIADASGAEVWTHELDRPLIRDFSSIVERRNEYYRDILRTTGFPDETLQLIAGFFDYLRGLGRETPVARTFRDGDRIAAAGWDLEVLHTPGHSPGSSCLRHRSTLFTGDTVLKHITPNAAFGGADGKSLGMGDYLTSLERLSHLELDAVHENGLAARDAEVQEAVHHAAPVALQGQLDVDFGLGRVDVEAGV